MPSSSQQQQQQKQQFEVDDLSTISNDIPIKFGRGTISICKRFERLLIVAFDRPLVKNAFNDDLYLDLIDILDLVKITTTLVGIVLTGTGSYFSSGADLSSKRFQSLKTTTTFEEEKKQQQEKTKKNNTKNDTVDIGTQPLRDWATMRFVSTVIDFPKLLVAAVNGPVVGIGFTLLLHCDLVFCSSNATFWAPFTRIALVPEFCSSITFQETMGISKANELLLLGKRITAQTALEWNICSRIIDSSSTNNYNTNNPFDSNSIASKMCIILYNQLLSLPQSSNTISIFISLCKNNSRKGKLQQIGYEEFTLLQKRFQLGHVKEAYKELQKQLVLSKKKNSKNKNKKEQQHQPRSKL